jgi:hypothetical protein
MKFTLVLSAAFAATLGIAGIAAAQTGSFGSDTDTGAPGVAIGSGPIGPNTSPAPPPPLRTTPGGGSGPIDTFGYGNAGDGYSGASAPGGLNGPGIVPPPAIPPTVAPTR